MDLLSLESHSVNDGISEAHHSLYVIEDTIEVGIKKRWGVWLAKVDV